jgi:flagellar hook-length control protein FliK
VSDEEGQRVAANRSSTTCREPTVAGLDSLLNLTAAASRPAPPSQPVPSDSQSDRGFSDRLQSAVQPRPDTESSRNSSRVGSNDKTTADSSRSRGDANSAPARSAPSNAAPEPDRPEVDPSEVTPAVAPTTPQATTPAPPTPATANDAPASAPAQAVIPTPAITQAAPQSLVDALSQTAVAETAAAPASDSTIGLSPLDPIASLTGTLVEELPSPPAAELMLAESAGQSLTSTNALASDDASAAKTLPAQATETAESIPSGPLPGPTLDLATVPQEQTPSQASAAASTAADELQLFSRAQSQAGSQSGRGDTGGLPVPPSLPADLTETSGSGPVDPAAATLANNPASPSASVSTTPATPPGLWLAALETPSKTIDAEPVSDAINGATAADADAPPLGASKPAAAPHGLFAGLWVDAVVTPRGPAPAREELATGETWNDLLAADPFAAATPETATSQSPTPTAQASASPLDVTATPVSAAGSTSQSRQVTPQRVIDQVVPAVVASTQGGHEVRIRLNPPELGSLLVDIRVRDGVVSAHLEATQSTTQQLVTDNLSLLRDGLAQQGLTIDRIEVTLAESPLGRDQTSSNRQGNQSGRDDAPTPYLDASEQLPPTTGPRAVPAPKFMRVNQGLDIQV